ncbi:MAG: hypothetical protein KME29_15785 [Calothrix sp. FI2-JRJ7]|jgi:hypothetical protein|nr:hypothetical protein [Calothrix sp. FI2-JRJ7]
MYLRRLLLVTALVFSSTLPALAQYNDPVTEQRRRLKEFEQVTKGSDPELECIVNGNCPGTNNTNIEPLGLILGSIGIGMIVIAIKMGREEKLAKEKAAENNETSKL